MTLKGQKLKKIIFFWKMKIFKALQNPSGNLRQAEFMIYYVKRPEFYEYLGFIAETDWEGLQIIPFFEKSRFSTKIYGFSKKIFGLK